MSEQTPTYRTRPHCNGLIIAVDFDGTIVEDRYPHIGPLRQGADKALKELALMGHKIIIWTCRTGHHALEARRYLLNAGIPYHKFNEACPDNVAKYESDTRKIYADLYIDDRCIAGLPEWSEIVERVMQRSRLAVDRIIIDETL